MRRRALAVPALVLAVVLATSAAAVPAVAVAQSGGTTVEVVTDSPSGVLKFDATITGPDDSTIARIDPVAVRDVPVQEGGVGDSFVRARTAHIASGPVGETVLFRVVFEERVDGSEVSMSVNVLTDDDDESLDPSVASVRVVGSDAADSTPEDTPTATRPPDDDDDDQGDQQGDGQQDATPTPTPVPDDAEPSPTPTPSPAPADAGTDDDSGDGDGDGAGAGVDSSDGSAEGSDGSNAADGSGDSGGDGTGDDGAAGGSDGSGDGSGDSGGSGSVVPSIGVAALVLVLLLGAFLALRRQ